MTTILEAAEALRKGQTTSEELTRVCLARVDRLSHLNAFVTVLADRAIADAQRLDAQRRQGIDLGPLHGIPIALKDVFETKGLRTTCGSRLFANHTSQHDAAVAERLAAAGCVLIGKTNMHELAYGITSSNPHFGAVRNPWDPDRIPGGSSGGSGAAVAAGMALMAMGSDTGGSIRIPAAFCGTVGLKPTYGRVSRFGVMPLDFTLDHMGPLTRSCRDAALVLECLAGVDERDHTCANRPVDKYLPEAEASVQGLRIGLPENFYFERIDPEVRGLVEALARRLEEIGATVVPVRVPDIDGLNVVGRVILLVEASATMEPFLHRREDFGPDVLALFDQGRLLAGTQYVQAQRRRRMFQADFAKLFQTVDCLLTPTAPMPAPKIGATVVEISGKEEDIRLAATRYVRGVNVLGLPALSLPCGLVDALPVSAQLIGRPFEEALLLRIGAALEDAGSVSVPLLPEIQ
ncbi:MAG: Asp-tRNA(Asn)/Glu-tRNA(Gln) amidotransferase GatCAB subunit A [Bryobacterales bacterium]|nr:Asp-tRNA(Asn)/Glu-tRNA(Gln) amidotransferase GatCAB subunit A [Bryobacterales bacterium]